MDSAVEAVVDYCRNVTKEEINALPLFRYDGATHVVRTAEELYSALDRMRQERILGFDTESRPCFRKGASSKPSLIQVACSDIVFLIQLSWLPLDDALASLLADPSIIKAGVAIGDDMKLLARSHPFEGRGLVDLGRVAGSRGLSTRGLRSLAANFLGIRVSKGAQCSNWEHKELTPQQISYAATDAWISREVYVYMDALGFFLTPDTPEPSK